MTGHIWLAGVAEPIVLELASDCRPYLVREEIDRVRLAQLEW